MENPAKNTICLWYASNAGRGTGTVHDRRAYICDLFAIRLTSPWMGAAIIGKAYAPDEELHRHASENLAQADALLFGRRDLRNDGGSVAAVNQTW